MGTLIHAILMQFQFKGTVIEVSRLSCSEPVFLAKSVAEAIGIDVRNIASYLKGNLRPKDYRLVKPFTAGRPAYHVTEAGLYDLLLTANSELARDFRYWIIDEVLPTIRRDGGYVSPEITPEQGRKLKQEIDRILDRPDPWVAMWNDRTIERVHLFYGQWCFESFWWRWIYSFLTQEEREKLDRLNPIDPVTHRRPEAIHSWLSPEVKERLGGHVADIRACLMTANCRADFEAGVARLSGQDQLVLL